MARRHISQREARAALKRVAELEEVLSAQCRSWTSEWPGGVELGYLDYGTDHWLYSAVRTARRLGHAVVATHADDGRIRLLAKTLVAA